MAIIRTPKPISAPLSRAARRLYNHLLDLRDEWGTNDVKVGHDPAAWAADCTRAELRLVHEELKRAKLVTCKKGKWMFRYSILPAPK